jgi:uncharacterized membrane protein
MMYLGLALGAVMIVVAAATYWLAPKIGPNPWFGMRTGYSVASRDVWDKSNRLGGVLFGAVGLVEWLLTVAVTLLALDAATTSAVFMGWLVLGAGGATAWGLLYSRKLAQATQLARDLKPVPFRWSYVAPVLGSAAVLVAVALLFYPQLPADHIATHFAMDGSANGWMDRNGFMLSWLILAGLFTLLDLAVVVWTTKEPLIAVDRLGDKWWMGPERGLTFMAALFTFLNLFFCVIVWDTAAFTLQGAHAIPANMLIWTVVPILVAVVSGFFLLAQRKDLRA